MNSIIMAGENTDLDNIKSSVNVSLTDIKMSESEQNNFDVAI